MQVTSPRFALPAAAVGSTDGKIVKAQFFVARPGSGGVDRRYAEAIGENRRARLRTQGAPYSSGTQTASLALAGASLIYATLRV